jgi:DNA-binding transcriptional LysR family regulator
MKQIGFSCPPIDTDAFEAIPLLKGRVCLAMSKDHPPAKRRSVRIDELRNEKLIFLAEVV